MEDVEFFIGHAKNFRFENGVNSPIRAKFHQVGQTEGFDIIILPDDVFLHKIVKSVMQVNIAHRLYKVKICIKASQYYHCEGLMMKVVDFDFEK